MVLVVPVILMATMLVVQFGLAYYARQVLAGASHDGAAAAAREHSSPDAGAALAEQMIAESGGSLLDSYSAAASSDGRSITVTTRGKVVSLLPFFRTINVAASGSARIEAFDAQGDA